MKFLLMKEHRGLGKKPCRPTRKKGTPIYKESEKSEFLFYKKKKRISTQTLEDPPLKRNQHEPESDEPSLRTRRLPNSLL